MDTRSKIKELLQSSDSINWELGVTLMISQGVTVGEMINLLDIDNDSFQYNDKFIDSPQPYTSDILIYWGYCGEWFYHSGKGEKWFNECKVTSAYELQQLIDKITTE